MPTLTELANRYGCDKGTLVGPAGPPHGYTLVYDRLFAELAARDIRLLEIGTVQEASLRMWYDYFPRGSIVALDTRDLRQACNDRVTIFVGNPEDRHHLDWIVAESGGQFDIILDRGGHLTLSLGTLFPSLNPGGFYIAENLSAIPRAPESGTVDASDSTLAMLHGFLSGSDFRGALLSPDQIAYLDEHVASVALHCNDTLAVLRKRPSPAVPTISASNASAPVVIDPSRVGLLSGMRFDSSDEPVYALMVTGKDAFHRHLARNAAINFLAQTYGNRVLVIVNDGEFDIDIVNVPADRVVQVRPRERLALGRLRNLALDAIPDAALWVQWDDDDWRHPTLMTEQLRVLAASDSHTCFLQRQVKVALSQDAGWVDSSPGGFAGTLMSRKAPALRYPETAWGEDTVYGLAIKHRHRWIAWDNAPHAYLRFIHGHNTWVESHFRIDRQVPHQRLMPAESAEYLESVLPLYRDEQ